MADHITSSGAFATANMKPAAAGGENIDAAWGRAVGDNLGALRVRPNYFFPGSGTFGTSLNDTDPVRVGIAQDVLFQRWTYHNRLQGTYASNGTFGGLDGPDWYGTHGFFIFGDLGTYVGTYGSNSTTGTTHVLGSTFAFDIDLTPYVSAGSWATMVRYFSGTLGDFSGTNRISCIFGDSKLFTYWS
jgi:hypothetical protein